jgi:hypothetical protein
VHVLAKHDVGAEPGAWADHRARAELYIASERGVRVDEDRVMRSDGGETGGECTARLWLTHGEDNAGALSRRQEIFDGTKQPSTKPIE